MLNSAFKKLNQKGVFFFCKNENWLAFPKLVVWCESQVCKMQETDTIEISERMFCCWAGSV